MARFSIIDLDGGKSYALQPQNVDPQLFLRYATWTKLGNSLVYVYENDIYFRQVPTVVTADARLTSDGEPEGVFNGIPDWVYEGIVKMKTVSLFSVCNVSLRHQLTLQRRS